MSVPTSTLIPWAFTVLGGSTSLLWGVFLGHPYWAMVAALVLASAVLLASRAREARSAWTAVATPLLLVPVVGTVLNASDLTNFLMWSFGPGAFYMLSLIALAPLVPSGRRLSGAVLASLALLASVSMGCFGLLSLYYLDAILSTSYIVTNQDLMWPLTYLLAGGSFLTVAIYLLDVTPAALESREVSE